MRDKLEKYLLIKSQFPNKAGELDRILNTQKRLLMKMGNQKGNTGDLMLSVAQGYDVATDLLKWMHNVLQGVCEDADLIDGAKARNTIEFLKEDINKLNAEIDSLTGRKYK